MPEVPVEVLVPAAPEPVSVVDPEPVDPLPLVSGTQRTPAVAPVELDPVALESVELDPTEPDPVALEPAEPAVVSEPVPVLVPPVALPDVPAPVLVPVSLRVLPVLLPDGLPPVAPAVSGTMPGGQAADSDGTVIVSELPVAPAEADPELPVVLDPCVCATASHGAAASAHIHLAFRIRSSPLDERFASRRERARSVQAGARIVQGTSRREASPAKTPSAPPATTSSG